MFTMSMAGILVGLLLLIFVDFSQGFLGNNFDTDSGLIFLHEQCAKYGVTFDEKVFEKTKLCALKVANKNQQDRDEGLMGNGKHGILQPVCDFLPKGKRCYKESFELLQKCFPVIQDNAKIFNLNEILVNIEKALCSDDKDKRITGVLGDTAAAMPAFACGMQYYKAIGEDVMECPVVKKILMNPNFLNDEDEALCSAVDEIEDCLLNTLDMCGDNSGSVKKFVHKIYDILIGVAFKCDGHENF